MIRRIKHRWKVAGEVRYDDYFRASVPWWLRLKRFATDPRSEEDRFKDAYDAYLQDLAEGYRDQEEQ